MRPAQPGTPVAPGAAARTGGRGAKARHRAAHRRPGRGNRHVGRAERGVTLPLPWITARSETGARGEDPPAAADGRACRQLPAGALRARSFLLHAFGVPAWSNSRSARHLCPSQHGARHFVRQRRAAAGDPRTTNLSPRAMPTMVSR
jgi:hypothetical protein